MLTLVVLILGRWDQEDTNMVTNFFQDVIVNAKPKVVFQRNFDSFKIKQANWYKTIALIYRASTANLERFPPQDFHIFPWLLFIPPTHCCVRCIDSPQLASWDLHLLEMTCQIFQHRTRWNRI